MKFTKYNRRKIHKRLSRTDADIIAAKNMLDDKRNGIELPLSYYDEQSDKMCGKERRN